MSEIKANHLTAVMAFLHEHWPDLCLRADAWDKSSSTLHALARAMLRSTGCSTWWLLPTWSMISGVSPWEKGAHLGDAEQGLRSTLPYLVIP